MILLLAGLMALWSHSVMNAQDQFVYISDAGNFSSPPWQILKFDADGQNGEIFIDDHLAWPQDILFLENAGTVLISNLNNGRISRFDAATGEYIDEFATGLGGPTRMKVGSDGLLYALQWQGNGKVFRYSLDGTFVDEFTDVGVPTSIGLAWDASGNLYVSSYNGKFVRRFNPKGGDMGLFISSGLAGPTNIWFEPNGDLMVVDYNAGNVKRYNSEGMLIGTFISGLPQGEGVDFRSNGNILIGSGGLHSVREYSATGTFIDDLVPPGTLNLLTPNAVVLRTPGTSGVKTASQFQEVAIVTPSIGVKFQIAGIAYDTADSRLQVHNSEGRIMKEMHLSTGMELDASALSDGVYILTIRMEDGTTGRQKIIVQH
jgi:sugar lactone lactonase YvrE